MHRQRPLIARWSREGVSVRPGTGTWIEARQSWIKDLKNACFADRLSSHRFAANSSGSCYTRRLLVARHPQTLASGRRGLPAWNSIPYVCASSKSLDAYASSPPSSVFTWLPATEAGRPWFCSPRWLVDDLRLDQSMIAPRAFSVWARRSKAVCRPVGFPLLDG